MAIELPRVIEKIDELPETLREHLKDAYVPGSGDLHGKLVLAGTDPNIEKMQSILQTERSQRGAATAKVQELTQQIDGLQKDLAGLKKAKPDSPAESEVIKNLRESTTAQIEALKQQVAEERNIRLGAQKEMSQAQLEGALRKAAVDAGASEKTADDVVNRMRQRVVEKDGKHVVTKADGSIQLGRRENPTEPMSFKEFAASIVEDNPHLRRTSQGGGTGGGDRMPGANGDAQFVLSPEEARDPALYRAKKAEAKKAGRELVIIGAP